MVTLGGDDLTLFHHFLADGAHLVAGVAGFGAGGILLTPKLRLVAQGGDDLTFRNHRIADGAHRIAGVTGFGTGGVLLVANCGLVVKHGDVCHILGGGVLLAAEGDGGGVGGHALFRTSGSRLYLVGNVGRQGLHIVAAGAGKGSGGGLAVLTEGEDRLPIGMGMLAGALNENLIGDGLGAILRGDHNLNPILHGDDGDGVALGGVHSHLRQVLTLFQRQGHLILVIKPAHHTLAVQENILHGNGAAGGGGEAVDFQLVNAHPLIFLRRHNHPDGGGLYRLKEGIQHLGVVGRGRNLILSDDGNGLPMLTAVHHRPVLTVIHLAGVKVQILIIAGVVLNHIGGRQANLVACSHIGIIAGVFVDKAQGYMVYHHFFLTQNDGNPGRIVVYTPLPVGPDLLALGYAEGAAAVVDVHDGVRVRCIEGHGQRQGVIAGQGQVVGGGTGGHPHLGGSSAGHALTQGDGAGHGNHSAVAHKVGGLHSLPHHRQILHGAVVEVDIHLTGQCRQGLFHGDGGHGLHRSHTQHRYGGLRLQGLAFHGTGYGKGASLGILAGINGVPNHIHFLIRADVHLSGDGGRQLGCNARIGGDLHRAVALYHHFRRGNGESGRSGAGIIADAPDGEGGFTGLDVVGIGDSIVQAVGQSLTVQGYGELRLNFKAGILEAVLVQGNLSRRQVNLFRSHTHPQLSTGHEPIGHISGRTPGLHTVEPDVLRLHRVKGGNLPIGGVGPGAGGYLVPVLLVGADLDAIFGNNTVGDGISGLIPQGIQGLNLIQIQLDIALLRLILQIFIPLAVPEGGRVVVNGKLLGAFVAADGLFAGHLHGGIAVGVIPGGIGRIVGGLGVQQNPVFAGGAVVLGLGENLHHILIGRQDGVGGVIVAFHSDVLRKQSLRGELPLLQLIVVPSLPVDGNTGQGSGAAYREADLSGLQLHFAQTHAVSLGGGSGLAFLIGQGDSQEHAVLGCKAVYPAGHIVGRFRVLSVLGDCQGIPLVSVVAPGHLHGTGQSCGIAVGVEVHHHLSQQLGSIIPEGEAGLLLTILGSGIVAPDGGVGAAAVVRVCDGAAVPDGLQGVALLSGGHILGQAGGVGCHIAADAHRTLRHTDRSGDGKFLTEHGALTGDGVGALGLGDCGVILPRHRELGVENGAVCQHGGTGLGQGQVAAQNCGSGVVQQGCHLVQHGDIHGNGDRGALQGAGDSEGAGLLNQAFVISIPDHILLLLGAVAIGHGDLLGQLRHRAHLHIVVAGDGVADDGVVSVAGVVRLRGGHGDRGALQPLRLSGDSEGTGLVGGLHHRHQLAGAGVPAQALVGGVVSLAAVVHADDLAFSGDGQLHIHIIGVHRIAVGILHGNGHIAQVVSVGGDGGAVCHGLQLVGAIGGVDHAAAFGVGDFGLTVSLIGLYLQGAFLIGNPEGGVQALVAGLLVKVVGALHGVGGPGAVGIAGMGGMYLRLGRAYQIAVAVELDNGSVGVNHHFHIMAGAEYHLILVPGGQQVQGGYVLIPLALIEPIGILGDAVGVDDAEVRGLGRRPGAAGAGAGAVPGGGLADVVKAGPHELAGAGIVGGHTPPGVAGHSAPAHGTLVVGGQELVIPFVLLATLPVVHAVAVDGGGGLGVVDLPALGDAVVQVSNGGVVIAHNAAVLGYHLGYLVGNVPVGFQLVVAECGRTGGVLFLDPINQVLGQGRILAVAAAAYAFKNLIAQAVHDDSGGIPVLANHGLDVELRPGHVGLAAENLVVGADGAVEPCRIVVHIAVLGLNPGIKCLVNEHHPLPVGNFHQGRGCRVVGDTDGIDAHVLQNLHLPLDGPVPGLGAQGALVMVHTHALELHGHAVELKAVVGVEVGPAEAELGGVGVHHHILHHHFRLYIVQVGGVGGPELGRGDGALLVCSLLSAGLQGQGGVRQGGHRRLTARGVHRLFHHSHDCRVPLVLHSGFHMNRGIGLIFGQIRGGHMGSLPLHMDGIGHGQGHIPVDAAAGVPTAGRGAMVHLHRQYILPFKVQQLLGQLEGESGIAVGMEAQLLTV